MRGHAIPRKGPTRGSPGARSNPGVPQRRHVRKNLRLWDKIAAEYEKRHSKSLRGRAAMSWGLWRIPESRLRLLGPVSGQRVLELGCGAADWSIALARRGSRVVGLDFSGARLRQAARNASHQGVRLPLIRATAERLPFSDGAFDLVFCDWGAMTFADPRRTVPEAARILAAGGRFVFSTDSPVHFLVMDIRRDRSTRVFQRDYFGLHRLEFPDEVNFQLPFGEWIALFRRNHLTVERLVETRPTPGTRSTYRTKVETDWSMRWPAECIWELRKEKPVPERRTPGAGGRPDRAGADR